MYQLKRKISIIFLFVILFPKIFIAQLYPNDCVNAVNICSNGAISISNSGEGNVVDFIGYNNDTSNNISNPNFQNNSPWGGVNGGCLGDGEKNSTWMIISVESTGILEMSFGAENAQEGYYDWIMWPYSDSACTAINGNTLPPVRCNWNSSNSGGTGIADSLPVGADSGNYEPGLNVNCGEKYVICLSNYNGVTANVPIEFFGNSYIGCDTITNIEVNSDTICFSECATLNASGGNSYIWDNSPFINVINDSTAEVCPNTLGVHSLVVLGNSTCGIDSVEVFVTVLPLQDSACSYCNQDTLYHNIYDTVTTYQTIFDTITFYDTLTTCDSTIINYENITVYDTSLTCDSVIYSYDTITYQDTLVTNIYDTITLQDTLITYVYDTITSTEITFDTLTTYQTVYDTSYVSIFDSIITYDTVEVQVIDTNYIYLAVTDTLYIDITLTSIPNIYNTIRIYPNPSSDYVIIDNGNYSIMSNYFLTILNSLSQQVFFSQINTPQFQIPVTSLGSEGIYFVNIYDNSGNLIVTKSLILN